MTSIRAAFALLFIASCCWPGGSQFLRLPEGQSHDIRLLWCIFLPERRKTGSRRRVKISSSIMLKSGVLTRCQPSESVACGVRQGVPIMLTLANYRIVQRRHTAGRLETRRYHHASAGYTARYWNVAGTPAEHGCPAFLSASKS